MFRLKRIGFLLVLPAMLAFFFHAMHPHAHASKLSDHDCAICQTPTLSAQPVTHDIAPSFSFTRYVFLHQTDFFQLPAFPSASPRAPPAA